MPKFPANILTVLNGTNGFVFTDLSASNFITSVPLATGDMNGDGIVDFAIADSTIETNGDGTLNDGHVYVIFGDSSYPASVSASSNLDGAKGFRVVGFTKTSLGSAVKFIDINKDGFDDLFIGASEGSKTTLQSDTTGWTYAIYGKNSASYPATFNVSALDGVNGFTIGGSTEDEYLGTSITATDVNNDSFQDAIITATGKAYVLYGKTTAFPSFINATNIGGTNGFKIIGLTSYAVSAADIDQDGLQDIMLSQLTNSYVIFGNATFPMAVDVSSLNGMNGFKITVQSDASRVLVEAGDLNQDGYPDLLIGTTDNSLPGKVSALFSHARPYPTVVNSLSLDGTNGTNFLGASNTDYFGHSISRGYMGSQFVTIVSAPLFNSFSGRVVGIYGSTNPFPASFSITNLSTACKGFIIDGVSGRQVGASTTMADINKDGVSDFLVRSNDKVYVVYGKPPQAQTLNLALTSATYTEQDSPLTLDNGLMLAAGDCDYITTATVTITNVQAGDVLEMLPQPNIVATYDAGTGTLTLNGSTVVSEYQTALRSVTFSNPSQALDPTPRTITFAGINPINEIVSANMTLNIISVNDVPVLTGNSTVLEHTSNQPLVIDNSITLSDVDNTSFVSATISVSSGFVHGDVLSFTNQNDISGQYNSNTGILTLTGSASVANYQAALRSITYQTTNSAALSNREISFLVNDGTDDSNMITRPINIIPLFNLLSGINDELICFNQKQSEKLIAPQISIVGDNALTLESATVTVSDPVTAEDALEFTDLGNGITGNYDSNTGVLTLIGPATASDFEVILRTVKYTNSNNVTDSSTKMFTVAVDYVGLSSNTLQSQIDLITINDAPVVINPVKDFNVTVNVPFSTVLSDNTFSQPVNKLSLSVKANDGDLTSLNFDASTRTLSGSLTTVNENRFSFFASDRCNQTALSNFTINAAAAPEDSAVTPEPDKTGPLVGGIVGGFVGLLLLLGGVFLLVMWRRNRKQEDNDVESAPIDAEMMMSVTGENGAVMTNPAYKDRKKSWYNQLYKSFRNLVVTSEKPTSSPSLPVVAKETPVDFVETSNRSSQAPSASSAKSANSTEKKSSIANPVADLPEVHNDTEEKAENSSSSSTSRYTP